MSDKRTEEVAELIDDVLSDFFVGPLLREMRRDIKRGKLSPKALEPEDWVPDEMDRKEAAAFEWLKANYGDWEQCAEIADQIDGPITRDAIRQAIASDGYIGTVYESFYNELFYDCD